MNVALDNYRETTQGFIFHELKKAIGMKTNNNNKKNYSVK